MRDEVVRLQHIAEMDRGTDPTNPKVQALAIRWMKLMEEKTAGDAELAKGFGKIIEQEPTFAAESVAKWGALSR